MIRMVMIYGGAGEGGPLRYRPRHRDENPVAWIRVACAAVVIEDGRSLYLHRKRGELGPLSPEALLALGREKSRGLRVWRDDLAVRPRRGRGRPRTKPRTKQSAFLRLDPTAAAVPTNRTPSARPRPRRRPAEGPELPGFNA